MDKNLSFKQAKIKRNKVRNRLRDSLLKYQALIESTNDFIWETDTQGKYTYCSPQMEQLWNLNPEEMIGKTPFDLMPEKDREQALSYFREMMVKPAPFKGMVTPAVLSGGRLAFLETNGVPFYDHKGRLLGYRGISRDITDRIKAEEELKKSEQLYRAIGESIDYGIWICDAEGRNIYASQSYLDLVGITQEQCSEFGWGDTLHPDDAEKTMAAWKECSKTGMKWDIEHRFRGVDGKWHPILARGIPIRDDKGNIQLWAGINLDISSLKQVQEELRKNEERYRNLVKYAPSVIYEVTLDGTRFISINDTMCQILGYTREELITIRPLDLLDEASKMIFMGRVRNHLKGEMIDGEVSYRIRKKNGEWIDTLIKIGNVSYSSENEPSVLVTAYDVTEQKRMVEDLRESEKRFRELVRRAPTAIYEIDFLSKKFLSVNDAFCKLSGYSREEALNMNALDLLTSDSKTIFLDRINRCMKGEKPEEDIEYEVITRDGSIINAILNMNFNYNEEGRITGAMVVGHDITERKKAEDSLRDAQAKLNIALENGNIGIWEWNLKTDEVVCDERTERMLGLQQGTFGGTYESFEELVHEEDIVHLRKSSEEAITKGIPFETIFRLKPVDNKFKYLSTKALVTKDNEGNPVRFSGVCFDVTGFKEGTERLALKLNEELLRSNKELERFAYVASHDLQEPLRMVSSFTQMLKQRYADKLDKNAHDYIDFAVDGAKRMHDQINGLLEYSRVNTKGRIFTKVCMNDVVHKVIAILGNTAKLKNIRIIAGELPDIIADELQMVQLLQNLLSNAIKFSGKDKNVYVDYETENDRYVFSVRDEGIGIEARYYELIFEIFQRLMPRSEYEGTGIGLSICQRIVERHQGRIWVQSVPGEGSTFFFTLPKNIE